MGLVSAATAAAARFAPDSSLRQLAIQSGRTAGASDSGRDLGGQEPATRPDRLRARSLPGDQRLGRGAAIQSCSGYVVYLDGASHLGQLPDSALANEPS